jgi:hypothetical protein
VWVERDGGEILEISFGACLLWEGSKWMEFLEFLDRSDCLVWFDQ